MTWEEARSYAQSRGGDLTSIGSDDWWFISAAFEPPLGSVSYWVGAHQDPQADEPGEGWSWVDGTDIDGFMWVQGELYDEPDDGGEGDCPPTCLDHDVAEMVIDDDGDCGNDQLRDEHASELRRAIMERPADAACDPENGDQWFDFQRTFAWQFRYDTPRGRYMRRMLDPDTLAEVITEWSDYDFDMAWSDFTIEGTAAVPTRNYLPPIAHADVDTNGDWTDQAVYHGNQIGSTELLTDETANVVREWAYTAFGQPGDLGGSAESRYRYAGAWGYQSHDDFPFLHVGHRWYDPETGRFLQRDPIGIRGGLNVYEYVRSLPTMRLDPNGLFDEELGLIWGICGAVIAALTGPPGWVVGAAGATSFVAGGYEPGDAEQVFGGLMVGVEAVANPGYDWWDNHGTGPSWDSPSWGGAL